MNGQDLSRKLQGLSVAQLRTLWTAACREMGWSTKQAFLQYGMGEVDRNSSPLMQVFNLIWTVYCAKRVFTPTGRKVWESNYTLSGSGAWVNQRTCSWDESNAAVERIFAALG